MTAWVLVADSSRATIFAADEALDPLRPIQTFDHPASRAKVSELISQSGERRAHHASSMNPAESPKQHEALIFARDLAEHLRLGRVNGAFRKLYIAASPQFLGLLRSTLDHVTQRLLKAELNKDLTRLDAEELRQLLPRRL